jgi:hypothetical protein
MNTFIERLKKHPWNTNQPLMAVLEDFERRLADLEEINKLERRTNGKKETRQKEAAA